MYRKFIQSPLFIRTMVAVEIPTFLKTMVDSDPCILPVRARPLFLTNLDSTLRVFSLTNKAVRVRSTLANNLQIQLRMAVSMQDSTEKWPWFITTSCKWTPDWAIRKLKKLRRLSGIIVSSTERDFTRIRSPLLKKNTRSLFTVQAKIILLKDLTLIALKLTTKTRQVMEFVI